MENVFLNKDVFKGAYILMLKNLFNKKVEDASVYERYAALAALLDKQLETDYEATTAYVEKNNLKKTIYFSMEFLMGRLITSNLMNAGYTEVVRAAFSDFGIDLNEVELAETDAGLGNGGLGRLAACFLDSAASLSLPLYGNSLRYSKGFFIQEIVNNKQIEKPDNWLEKGFMWEDEKREEAIDIPFYGYVKNTKLIDPIWVKAVPYDVKIVGNDNGVATHLRLWSTEPSELQKHQDEKYLKIVETISESLYPDDSTSEGKELRVMQQYVLSATGVQAAIKEHLSLGRDIKELDKYYTFQINDTHPTMVIAELMRILMDIHHLEIGRAH